MKKGALLPLSPPFTRAAVVLLLLPVKSSSFPRFPDAFRAAGQEPTAECVDPTLLPRGKSLPVELMKNGCWNRPYKEPSSPIRRVHSPRGSSHDIIA
ncbi:unnamed protein product [Victoria cruziana]